MKAAQLIGFLTDRITEAWIDFSYGGYEFTVSSTFGSYWFYVSERSCPDEVLIEVLAHCEVLLGEE